MNSPWSRLFLPEDISTHGGQVDSIIWYLHYFMFALFVGWGIFFVYCLIRFRGGASGRASYDGTHSRFPTSIEIGVVIVEVILLVGFSMPVWAHFKHDFPKETEATVVNLVGQQFRWMVHYPGKDGKFGRMSTDLVTDSNTIGLDRNDPAGKDDIVTVGQLHLPVGKPVIARITSTDVIHSFKLPVMRLTQDAIPGMTIPIWFQATKTGHWDIACAQLCGLGHYRMRGDLYIDSDEDFAKWMKEQEDILASGGDSYE